MGTSATVTGGKGVALFNNIKVLLQKELTEKLKKEVQIMQFAHPKGLGAIPAVDSKAVVKLSPIVEKHTGSKINTKWIKKGGYNSVNEAIADLLSHIEKDMAVK